MALLSRAFLRVVAAALSAALTAPPVLARVTPGEVAPDFELRDLAGRTERLSAWRGHIVLLDFWASWCAPCAAELSCLDELRKRHGAAVQLISVSIDRDAETARRFVAAKLPAAELRVLHDEGSEVLAEWGADGMPALYLIDRDGIVREAHDGAGGCHAVQPKLRELLGAETPLEDTPALP